MQVLQDDERMFYLYGGVAGGLATFAGVLVFVLATRCRLIKSPQSVSETPAMRLPAMGLRMISNAY